MNINEDTTSANSLSSESGRQANETTQLIERDSKNANKRQGQCFAIMILLFLAILISVCVALGAVLPIAAKKSIKACPSLEHDQLHGNFSESVNRTFHSGDSVQLVCDPGYYVSNDCNNPEEQTLTCLYDGTWDVKNQTQCLPILKVVNSRVSLSTVFGEYRYAMLNCPNYIQLNESLYSFACGLIGGYKMLSTIEMNATCSINYQLTNNPFIFNGSINTFAGVLNIVYEGYKLERDAICFSVDDTDSLQSLARSICQRLGYGQYTHSIISDVTAIFNSTKLITYREGTDYFEMTNKKQQCSKMISCRGTCHPVKGTESEYCTNVLEGETCTFKCSPGSELFGQPELTCLGNGTWSGGHCNDTAWKGEVNNFVNSRPGGLSNSDLALQLAEYIYPLYEDFTWVVLVYDPVDGYVHSVADNSPDNVHGLTNFNGYDIAVSRVFKSDTDDCADCRDNLIDLIQDHFQCKDHNRLIDCPKTTFAILPYLITYYDTINMLFAVREGNNLAGVAVRKDSATGDVSQSISFINNPGAAVVWDTRVAAYTYGDHCSGVHLVLVADPPQ